MSASPSRYPPAIRYLPTNPVSFVELGEQHVALLPARTVLSLLSAGPADGANGGDRAIPASLVKAFMAMAGR
jgi:hypothetical protein